MSDNKHQIYVTYEGTFPVEVDCVDCECGKMLNFTIKRGYAQALDILVEPHFCKQEN